MINLLKKHYTIIKYINYTILLFIIKQVFIFEIYIDIKQKYSF